MIGYKAPEICLLTQTITILADSVWCNYSGTLKSTEGLQLSGVRFRWYIVINFSLFQLLAQQQLLISLSPIADSCVFVPGAALTQLARARVSKKKKKDLVFWILEICVFWLLIVANDHRGAKKVVTAIVVAPSHIAANPTPSADMTFTGHRGLVPFLPPSLFSFSSLRARLWQLGYSSNCAYGRN